MEITLEEEKLMNATIPHCCSICLYSVTDNVLLRPCYHVFCRACIEKWFARSCSCPNCRALIDVYLRKAEVTGLIIPILLPVSNAIANRYPSSSSSSSSDDEDNEEDSSDDEEDSFQTEQIIMNGVEYLPRTSSAVVVSAALRQVERGEAEQQLNHSDFYYVSDLRELQQDGDRDRIAVDNLTVVGRQEIDAQAEASHRASQEQQQPNYSNDGSDSLVRIFANIHVDEDISDFRWDSSNRNDDDDNDNTDLGENVNIGFITAQDPNDTAEENAEAAMVNPCVPCIMHQRELQSVSNGHILP